MSYIFCDGFLKALFIDSRKLKS